MLNVGRSLNPGVNHRNVSSFSFNFRNLIFSKQLTLDFYCEFELDWYPFDKQNCNIEVENFGNKGSVALKCITLLV